MAASRITLTAEELAGIVKAAVTEAVAAVQVAPVAPVAPKVQGTVERLKRDGSPSARLGYPCAAPEPCSAVLRTASRAASHGNTNLKGGGHAALR